MHLNHFHKIVCFLFAALFFIGLQAICLADVPKKTAEEKKELKFTEKMAAILFQEADDSFFYKREGRADPFVPFIKERVVATETPVEELTGMRKFEPGQLSVVAIVMSANDRFAMVQDSNNQGYIIREGILLGRTGTVEAIVPNKVIA